MAESFRQQQIDDLRAYKVICSNCSTPPDMGKMFPSLAGLQHAHDEDDLDLGDEDTACQVITSEMAKYR